MKEHWAFWPLLTLLCTGHVLMLRASRTQNLDDILPPPQKYLGDQVQEYMRAQGHTLAPPLVTSMDIDSFERVKFIETTNSIGDKEYYELHSDSSDRPKPWIIKISHTKYLIWRQGDILIHKIERGAEDLFDQFWGIQKPPEPPRGGDSSDGWKSDNDRWDYKP